MSDVSCPTFHVGAVRWGEQVAAALVSMSLRSFLDAFFGALVTAGSCQEAAVTSGRST